MSITQTYQKTYFEVELMVNTLEVCQWRNYQLQQLNYTVYMIV